MSHRGLGHSREQYKRGRTRTWVIEEKLGNEWRTVKEYKGENGPKAQKGQRVRLLKDKRFHDSFEWRMSDEEVGNILGF